MAGYVTMHEPTTRVISLEGDDNEATIRQEYYISSWRIVKGEIELARVVLLILLTPERKA
jgi:hypothetical protein